MLLKNALISIIKYYRNYISTLMLYKCRFCPTCSAYTLSAIEHEGVIAGLVKAGLRIIKCHPFNPGGFDPYIKPVQNKPWKKDL